MKNIILLFTLLIFSVSCATKAQSKIAYTEQEKFKLAAEYSKEFRGLSVLISKSNKIVFEEYQNGHSADKAHLLASGTKSFSGVILAAAIEDKLVSGFDEKVSETITEWKSDAQKSKITLRQLLSLTSGIDAGAIGKPPTYAKAVKSSVKFEAGTKFEYGPAPFQIFGEFMRRKLQPKNESVENYLKRRILSPIGLNVASWTKQEDQINLPSGAYLTAREWIKFGQFLQNGGTWNGKKTIDKKLLDECFKGSAANPNYGLTFWLNRDNEQSAKLAEKPKSILREILSIQSETDEISLNGFGNEIPKDVYVAAGAGKQRLYVIPSLNLVIVRQGKQARFNDREFLSRLILGKSAGESK